MLKCDLRFCVTLVVKKVCNKREKKVMSENEMMLMEMTMKMDLYSEQ